MAVIPNDPPIPLWVLQRIPDSRDKPGFKSLMRTLIILQIANLALVCFMYVNAIAPLVPHPWDRWFLLLFIGVFCVRDLNEAFIVRAAERWLDQHESWGSVHSLQIEPPTTIPYPRWLVYGIVMISTTALLTAIYYHWL